MPAYFNPYVVAATGRNDAEAVTGRERGRAKVALHCADLPERVPCVGRQQLVEHPFDRVEGEGPRRELQLTGGRDDVRALAGVQDQRVSIRTNDGCQQRGYERHNLSTG